MTPLLWIVGACVLYMALLIGALLLLTGLNDE